MTLTEFLLARIAEDDAVAREVRGRQIETEPFLVRESFGPDDERDLNAVEVSGEPAVLISTGRVLAECEAKRRIVEDLVHLERQPPVALPTSQGAAFAFRKFAEVMAAVYADHPDYREEWRP